MLNLAGLTKAPEWRVELRRKRCLNEVQNARQKVCYVVAPDEATAKQLAARKHPEFIAERARRS